MEKIQNPEIVIPLSILGFIILGWLIWDFLISPSIPKRTTTSIKLASGNYTFVGTAKTQSEDILVSGVMFTKEDNVQNPPYNIHFWLPRGISLERINITYLANSMYQGPVLRDEESNVMYLAGGTSVSTYR